MRKYNQQNNLKQSHKTLEISLLWLKKKGHNGISILPFSGFQTSNSKCTQAQIQKKLTKF